MYAQSFVDYALGLGQHALNMIPALEAFGVYLVNILGTRWPGREPAAFRHDFNAPYRRIVAGCPCQDRLDFFPGEILDMHLIGGQFGQALLLSGRGRCLETAGNGRSEEHTSELQSLMRISYAVIC